MREVGFYWVLLGEAYTGPGEAPRWVVAEWDGCDWLLPGYDCPDSGENIARVGARVVRPLVVAVR